MQLCTTNLSHATIINSQNLFFVFQSVAAWRSCRSCLSIEPFPPRPCTFPRAFCGSRRLGHRDRNGMILRRRNDRSDCVHNRGVVADNQLETMPVAAAAAATLATHFDHSDRAPPLGLAHRKLIRWQACDLVLRVVRRKTCCPTKHARRNAHADASISSGTERTTRFVHRVNPSRRCATRPTVATHKNTWRCPPQHLYLDFSAKGCFLAGDLLDPHGGERLQRREGVGPRFYPERGNNTSTIVLTVPQSSRTIISRLWRKQVSLRRDLSRPSPQANAWRSPAPHLRAANKWRPRHIQNTRAREDRALHAI